jgi:hypothetical protein
VVGRCLGCAQPRGSGWVRVVLVVCWGVVSGLWVFFGGCVRQRVGLGVGGCCVYWCADRFSLYI